MANMQLQVKKAFENLDPVDGFMKELYKQARKSTKKLDQIQNIEEGLTKGKKNPTRNPGKVG